MRNLGTKEQRLQLLEYKTKALTEKGYIKETYRDLLIFTNEPELTLKIFRGTATNPIHFVRYRTLERLEQVKNTYKEYADAREKRKQDEAGNRVLSQSAQCAAAIRAELKDKFPHCKFSVTSSNFSGGNSVHIDWKDGATVAQVEAITGKYQYGHFNSMEDMYEYSNNIEGLPQAKYVSESRKMSEELKAILFPQLKELLPNYEPTSYRDDLDSILYQIWRRTEIKDINNIKGIEFCINNELPGIAGNYKITFINEEKQTVNEKPNLKPIESTAGEVNIIEYSEKAIAVVGDTKPIKELLKSLGGSFNARLSCGPGWIFSKKKLQELQTALLNINNAKTEETPKEEKQDLTPVLFSEIKAIQEPETLQAEEMQEIPGPPPAINEALTLESFKILWHEGRHIEGAIFEGATFTDWQEVQKAFYKLWEVNEKGSDGGYTKVKCEIKLKGSEVRIDRIDITNRIKNGDFNPSDMHILEYLESILTEEESQEEITAAANAGKQVSIYNLFSLVQEPIIS